MKSIYKIPYFNSYMELNLDKYPVAVLRNRLQEIKRHCTEKALVERALDHPIGTDRLETMIAGKSSICIITSDHTRPIPSRITMKILLKRIRSSNPDIKVVILIATGVHRSSTREELINKFGEEIVEHENIIMHQSTKDEVMVDLGILPSGGRCLINRYALEADFLISEGFIEPHFFAGYSGGRKSILPGIASKTTVLANHCGKFIADASARAGNLEDNPIHRDMLYAAKESGLSFILNVVLDEEKHIINAFAGDFNKAHQTGCDWLSNYVQVPKTEGDIIVVGNGGYPLDQNIYQSVKGMTAAEVCCREGGVIVMVASCSDGHGGDAFYKSVKECESPSELLQRIKVIPADETEPDQWEYQILARILKRFTVIIVTQHCDPALITDMKMLHAFNLDQAMSKAGVIIGKDEPDVVVIPDGVGIIVKT